jgi:hypothetical protein
LKRSDALSDLIRLAQLSKVKKLHLANFDLMIPGRDNRLGPIPGLFTEMYKIDYKVRKPLVAGYNPSLITQFVGLDARLIRQLEGEITNETDVSLSELHRIDPLLQYDDAHHDSMSQYIVPTSFRFSDASKRVQNPTEFVISLHRSVRGLTDADNACVVLWSLSVFFPSLFALPGRNSFVFSIVVLRRALSLMTNWQHPNRFHLITKADCIDFMLFHFQPHCFFHSEVIVDCPPKRTRESDLRISL